MLLQRIFTRIQPLITALDALTIGLFGVGAVSAVGGSILRDLLLSARAAPAAPRFSRDSGHRSLTGAQHSGQAARAGQFGPA